MAAIFAVTCGECGERVVTKGTGSKARKVHVSVMRGEKETHPVTKVNSVKVAEGV